MAYTFEMKTLLEISVIFQNCFLREDYNS